MVENLGRANFGSPHNFEQKKGLWEGDVLLDGRVLDDWEHISIEPTGPWMNLLEGWREYNRWLKPFLVRCDPYFLTFLQNGAGSFRTKDIEGRIRYYRCTNTSHVVFQECNPNFVALQKRLPQIPTLIMTALHACKSSSSASSPARTGQYQSNNYIVLVLVLNLGMLIVHLGWS